MEAYVKYMPRCARDRHEVQVLIESGIQQAHWHQQPYFLDLGWAALCIVSVSLSVDESYHEHNQREHWWEILVDLSDDCRIPGWLELNVRKVGLVCRAVLGIPT